MILYPAIDIRDGHAVRLTQGDYGQEQRYDADPLDAALRWVEQGAEWLHVIDLDGARDGSSANIEHLRRIAGATRIPVQTGGGLRDISAIDRALEAGAARVILGTAAFSDRMFLEDSVARYGDKIVVSLDARAGKIAAAGWVEQTDLDTGTAIKMFEAAGVMTFVYTDIGRDGMLSGTDLDGLRDLCLASTANLIASGGVGSLADLEALVALNLPNIDGVIAGKALYENRFTVAEALGVLSTGR